MEELTLQDKENYDKLKETFQDRATKQQEQEASLKEVVKLLAIDTMPSNTGELQQKIDVLDLYLKILELRKIELFQFNPPNPEKKEKLEQDFFASLEKLKLSLTVVRDDNLDLTGEIEDKRFDRLFLEFLPSANFKTWTEALLSDRDLNLNEGQIDGLVQAWGKSIQDFVEDARKAEGMGDKVTPGEPETFAKFFSIHNQLETLYSKLADTETVQRSR
jgi:hypothetical protein